jgi:hypothetical protein
MDQATLVLEDYQKNKMVQNEERTMWVGIFMMCGVIALDLALFLWIARIL